jgi:hypothetical protein
MRKRTISFPIEITYSKQAEDIIKNLKDFDYDKFERDYLSSIIIGDQTIWRYILEKEKRNG